MFRLVLLLTIFAFTNASAPLHHHELTIPKPTNAQLSGEVEPTAYTLTFRFENDFASTNAFSAITSIAITVGNITNAESSFQFHAKGLEFTNCTLVNGRDLVEATFSDIDPETDLVTVTPTTKLEPGKYTLNLEYNGVMSETSMVGVYKSTYINAFKEEKYVIATQFEEIHARKAFPCFDEPRFKATFRLTLIYPIGYRVLSNMVVGTPKTVDDLESATVGTSRLMSTYLLAFVISEFNCKNGDLYLDKIPTELCSQISAMDTSAKTALDAAPILLEIMTDYTNFNYSIAKLTLAAIPDFAPGAMENWGLITFRENDLLWNEGESSAYDKQTVVSVLAHEISHQWFGDLVTLDWWGNMFLNEGFATYFEYHATNEYQPEWKLLQQFVIEQLHSALDADASNSLPLSYDATNPDYSSRTNDVTYSKGGSVLRMIHHFLTGDKFQLGLADYINSNQMGTVTPDLLWESLQPQADSLENPSKLPQPLATIMENWIKKSGYPLLTVKSEGLNVIISQEQFVLSEEGSTKWYVPITYANSIDGFSDTSTKVWLGPEETVTLENEPGWVILNVQQVGYYRVNYEKSLLDKISNVLNSNFDDIDEISRAQLVDDEMSLAMAGISTYSNFLNFLKFIEKDDSYFTWYAAFNAFDFMLQKTTDIETSDSFKKFIINLMTALNESIQKPPTDQISILKQALAQSWACKLGDETCIKKFRDQFLAYKNDQTKPLPDDRSIAYCEGLRNSDNPTEDFTFLFNQYNQSKIPSEKVTILKALGCVKSPGIRQMYLRYALSEPNIRLQDARYVFSSVYLNSPEGISDVLDFVIEKYSQINEHFGGDSSTAKSLITTLGSLIYTQAQIDQLQAFSDSENLDDDVQASIANAITLARNNLNVTDTLVDALKSYFKDYDGNAAGSLTGSYIVNLLCLVAGYVMFSWH